MEISAFVHGRRPLVEQRTARALIRAGAGEAPRCLDTREIAEALEVATGAVVIAKAGAWFPSLRRIPELPPEGVWLAAGAWLGEGAAALKWARALARCGGDFSRLRWWDSAPPAPPSMLLSREAARRFGGLLRTMDEGDAWRAMHRSGARVVHLPELDARASDDVRVLQLVTTIQVGGAERVALLGRHRFWIAPREQKPARYSPFTRLGRALENKRV